MRSRLGANRISARGNRRIRFFGGFRDSLGDEAETGDAERDEQVLEVSFSADHGRVADYSWFVCQGRRNARGSAIFKGWAPGGACSLPSSRGTRQAGLSALSSTHRAPWPPSLGGAWQKARTS